MNLVNGIKNCEHITNLLNHIIKDTGTAIAIDNKKIWTGFLHQRDIDNDFWLDTIDAMEMLVREVPRKFRPFHRDAIIAARTAWIRWSDDNPRCMDQKENKGITWRLIMSVREVINAINEVDVPNR